MKQIIKNYTFDKTANKITFTDFTSISLNRLLLVTNSTANTVMYQFSDPASKGKVSGNVLTLSYDTTAMHNTDKLRIIYDCASSDPMYDIGGSSSNAWGNIASEVPVIDDTRQGEAHHAPALPFGHERQDDLHIDSHGRLLVGAALPAASANSPGHDHSAASVIGPADRLNSPTTSVIWAYPLTYDDANDRRHTIATKGLRQAEAVITRQTLASAMATTSGHAAVVTGLDLYREALITLNCTAVSGTAPRLTVRVQASDDCGATWYDLPHAAFTPLTRPGRQAITLGASSSSFGDTVRVAWTIAGKTPSFTFTVKGLFKS